MKFDRRRGTVALGALAAAAVLAGCATAVTGSAQPAGQQAGTVPSVSAPTEPLPTEPSGASSADPGTPGEPTEPTEPTAPTDSSEPSESSTESSAQSEPPTEPATESSEPADTTGSSEPSEDAARLYPTEPLAYKEFAPSEETGALIEARRLSAYVVSPSSIRENLTVSGGLSTLPLRGASAMGILLPDPAPEVAERAGMYSGFVATRSAPGDGEETLQIAVFLFDDAAGAKKGAAELVKATKDDGDKKLTVPGQKGAAGWLSPGEDDRPSTALAMMPSGSTVIFVWVSDAQSNEDYMPQNIGKAMKAQKDALADYQQTPRDKLTKLKIDPQGMLARTLPTAKGEGTVHNGDWPVHGALHLMIDYESSAKLFDEAGVDAFAYGRSTTYRAKDAAGAKKLVAAFIDEIGEKYQDMKPMDKTVEGAEVSCLNDPLSAQFYCAGSVDRVAFEYWAETEKDLDKSLEAQVAILTA